MSSNSLERRAGASRRGLRLLALVASLSLALAGLVGIGLAPAASAAPVEQTECTAPYVYNAISGYCEWEQTASPNESSSWACPAPYEAVSGTGAETVCKYTPTPEKTWKCPDGYSASGEVTQNTTCTKPGFQIGDGPCISLPRLSEEESVDAENFNVKSPCEKKAVFDEWECEVQVEDSSTQGSHGKKFHHERRGCGGNEGTTPECEPLYAPPIETVTYTCPTDYKPTGTVEKGTNCKLVLKEDPTCPEGYVPAGDYAKNAIAVQPVTPGLCVPDSWEPNEPSASADLLCDSWEASIEGYDEYTPVRVLIDDEEIDFQGGTDGDGDWSNDGDLDLEPGVHFLTVEILDGEDEWDFVVGAEVECGDTPVVEPTVFSASAAAQAGATVCVNDAPVGVGAIGSGSADSATSQEDAQTKAQAAANANAAANLNAEISKSGGSTSGSCGATPPVVAAATIAPVTAPAAATVAAPAPAKRPVKVPAPGSVSAGVAGSASSGSAAAGVPTSATVPSAVPAGDGSQAPALPMWALALIAVGVVGAAAAGKQMVGAKK